MAEMADCPVAVRGTRQSLEEIRHIAGYSSDQEVTNAATILCEVSSSNLGQQAQSSEGNGDAVDQQGAADETTDRRSKRKRKPVRRLSLSTLEEEPSEEADDGLTRAPSTKAGTATTSRILNPKKPADKRGRHGDELFSCDICKSNFIIPPKRKKSTGQRSWRVSVRYWVDPETNKKLKLCNACGLRANRNRSATARQEHATQEERNKYFENVQKFSQSLISELKDPDAERLTCPYFRTRTPCACVQKFIVGEGKNMEEAKKRAGQLLQIVKEAQRLRTKKFYNVEEVIKRSKRNRRVGMGNGQRKSKEYEELVLTKRAVLKDQLKFCEHATKRILLYSNNFLHKRLKTADPVLARRLEKATGGPKKKLKEIEALPETECCEDHCVLLARTHSVLLQRWRDRARKGQAEARKVLGEMLTPSGLRVNCHKFITMVTGCSTATVARVDQQMRVTGGDREPPPHGLKKYWEKQNRTGKASASKKPPKPVTISLATGERNPVPQPTKSEKQLKDQLLQLKKMQQKLLAQQNEINQQTKNLEKQLNLINKQKGALKTAPTTQYARIQPRPAQSSKETIGIPAMTVPVESSVLETIDPRVQQNMNQLLNQIQNQIANQTMLQIQQQLLNDVVKDSGTALGATNQPPPSYNVAVALASGTSLGQAGLGVPGQVILQALPVSCGDTITIQTQPLEGATLANGSSAPGLSILAQGDCQEDQGQDGTSAAQSLLVSISDMIGSESLDREMPLPEVIEIPETEPFPDAPFTEDLQTKSSDLPKQQSLLNDIEKTISGMTPVAPAPRSTAAILRKKPRSIVPAAPAVTVAPAVGFQRVIIRPSNDTPSLPELPGDMLMPSDPLQALSSTSQNLLLQTVPVNTITETALTATSSSS